MGHHTKNVFGSIADAGDVVQGAVGVGLVGNVPIFIAVTEEHLSVRLDLRQRLFIAVEATFTVGDGHTKDFVGIDFTGSYEVCVTGFEVYVFAIEFHVGVAEQRTGEEATFTENLKSVTDAEHETPFACVVSDCTHDGRQFGDGPRAKVIAIGKATGNKNVGTSL